MKWRGVNELREMYLSFFESKNHTRMASASLIPQGDNSLLLINSGMAPLKKFFLGQAVPPNKRVTTCQKCIRTPDIERVGKTSRHGTYFEMLGNFLLNRLSFLLKSYMCLYTRMTTKHMISGQSV